MQIPVPAVRQMLRQINHIISDLVETSRRFQAVLDRVQPAYRTSAESLLHYATFRQHDWRSLQKELRVLGLAGLAHSGSDLLSSLKRTHYLLSCMLSVGSAIPVEPVVPAAPSRRLGQLLLAEHTQALFGPTRAGRRVRIMVTMPREAAYDYEFVRGIIEKGTDCVRINCAHDEPEIWRAIIANVRRAGTELGLPVSVSMDLGGPKIRTGALQGGPQVRKFRPRRNEYGEVLQPARIRLVAADSPEVAAKDTLPMVSAAYADLQPGDTLRTIDTRGRKRRLEVVVGTENGLVLECDRTTYFRSGQLLRVVGRDFPLLRVGDLPALEQPIWLKIGDQLQVTRNPRPGQGAVLDKEGQLIHPAHVNCTLPEVFARVREGDPVLFDDGKIAGEVEGVEEEMFSVRITRAKATGSKLLAAKGMNFPKTDLRLRGLTDKDREDLRFVVQHADLVNCSFVQHPEDVRDIVSNLEDLGVANKLNLVLKIETWQAYKNLVAILLEAMRVQHIGVMIARGDLAVEVGWKRLSRVQEEILALCNAAHVPVIWATQVFENLAKEGMPSRAEISDVATALRAECVMLNKGPYIQHAIALLEEMLRDMESLHEKNQDMLPALV